MGYIQTAAAIVLEFIVELHLISGQIIPNNCRYMFTLYIIDFYLVYIYEIKVTDL